MRLWITPELSETRHPFLPLFFACDLLAATFLRLSCGFLPISFFFFSYGLTATFYFLETYLRHSCGVLTALRAVTYGPVLCEFILFFFTISVKLSSKFISSTVKKESFQIQCTELCSVQLCRGPYKSKSYGANENKSVEKFFPPIMHSTLYNLGRFEIA